MKKISTAIIALNLVLACHSSHNTSTKINGGELIFHSGFEPDAVVVSKNENADIAGMDKSVAKPNDWVNDLDNHPNIGNFGLQYEGGDSTMRYAKIVADPVNPSNKVLQFWMHQPTQKNGRIQATLYGNKGLKEIYQSVKMYIPSDINAVRSYPKEVHWLTISEFWNNITWSQNVPYGFRITLGIGKEGAAENELRFIIDAQDCQLFENGSQKYTTIWAEVNRSVKIPVDKWFTMDYYFKEGGNDRGRFYMHIWPDGGKKQVVFDIRKITHNTHDPAPDGLGDYNPLKLYTSSDLVKYVTSQNKTLQIYWDDLAIWKDRRPGN